MDKQSMKAIESEYRRIDNRWLSLHFKTTAGLVLFSLIVEIIIGIIMCNTDELHTTIPIFFLKFLVIPFTMNVLCVAIDFYVLKSKKVSQNTKIYTISLIFIAICFVLFTVHNVFVIMYFIFVVPILMTTVYANYRLTIITSVLSICSIVISELFVKWDIDKVSVMENPYILGNFLIAIFITLAFSGVCMVTIRFEREKNAASIQNELERYRLERKLQIDELTRVYNRKAFRSAIQDMEVNANDSTYIFVMIDIDNFKSLNDSLGHVKGDRCLIEFGKILKESCGDALPFRYGGDEFCILFRNYTLEEVHRTCEKIRKDCMQIKVDKKFDKVLTASFGIAEFSAGMSTSKLVVYTDKALYEAKKVKNTIHIHQDEVTA